MGQFFTLAPVPAGFRCGAATMEQPRFPRPVIQLTTPSFRIKSLVAKFPATLSLGVSAIRKAQGKGLNNVR